MTVTVMCGLCDSATLIPLGMRPKCCPVCGGGLRKVPVNRVCTLCGEKLVKPAALCGFCEIEKAGAA